MSPLRPICRCTWFSLVEILWRSKKCEKTNKNLSKWLHTRTSMLFVNAYLYLAGHRTMLWGTTRHPNYYKSGHHFKFPDRRARIFVKSEFSGLTLRLEKAKSTSTRKPDILYSFLLMHMYIMSGVLYLKKNDFSHADTFYELF